MKKPNCYKCVHRLGIPGDAHSRCNNHKAKVEGNPRGITNGWFMWPLNFDPTWLISCDGFSDNPEDKKPRIELDPLSELIAMLK
jgi:hypothetical protein